MLELHDKRSWDIQLPGLADSERRPFSARRRDFTSFSHVIGGSNRVFGLLGQLHLASGGRILLRDFMVALSGVCRSHETSSVVTAVVAEIERAGWEKIIGQEPKAFRSNGFELSVRVAVMFPGIEAVHVFLGYGSIEPFLAQYLGRRFPKHARWIVSTNDARDPSGRARGHPRTSHVIQTVDLARLLRREPCSVLTGAGISLASGILPFTGLGSLETYFRLVERFPGSAFDWVLHRPSELASLAGSFQASVLTARPNRAHLALVALESMGVVKQIITSNFDALHQLAGSHCVKEIGNGQDWADGFCGRMLLVTGVSHDEFGLVKAARASGMGVVILGPEVPEFVQESDLYLPGRAEAILPEVAEMFWA